MLLKTMKKNTLDYMWDAMKSTDNIIIEGFEAKNHDFETIRDIEMKNVFVRCKAKDLVEAIDKVFNDVKILDDR